MKYKFAKIYTQTSFPPIYRIKSTQRIEKTEANKSITKISAHVCCKSAMISLNPTDWSTVEFPKFATASFCSSVSALEAPSPGKHLSEIGFDGICLLEQSPQDISSLSSSTISAPLVGAGDKGSSLRIFEIMAEST